MQVFLAGDARKIDRLSGFVTESFRFLLRQADAWSSALSSTGDFQHHAIRQHGLRDPQAATVRGREAALRDLRAVGVGPRVGAGVGRP